MPAAASHEDIYHTGSDGATGRSNENHFISSSTLDPTTAVGSSFASSSLPSASSKAHCVMFKGAVKTLSEESPFRRSSPSYYCNLNQDYNEENLFINRQLDQQASSAHRQSTSQRVAQSGSSSLSTRGDNSNHHHHHHHHISMDEQFSSPLSTSLNSRHYQHDHSASTMNFFFSDDYDSDDRYYRHHFGSNNNNNNYHDHLDSSSSLDDFDTLMLLYDDSSASDPRLLTTRHESQLSPSMQQYLTIEELKVSRNSCWLCGCNWQQDHVSLDCPECGGYALTRPCPVCDGKCKQIWQRNLSTTHDSHKASWTGQCSLNGSCSAMETRTFDIGGNSVKSTTTTTLADMYAKITSALHEVNGAGLSLARRSSSCCSSTPSSVVSSDSEL